MNTKPTTAAGTPASTPAGTPAGTLTTNRLGRRLAAVLVALVAVLGGTAVAAPANADVGIVGVRFHTTVECGGSTMLFSTNTAMDSGSYVKLFVWDSATGRWITDNVWQRADAWASWHVAGINFRPGYYPVAVHYAQYTTAGWQYGSERISSFTQRSGYRSWRSSTCYMG